MKVQTLPLRQALKLVSSIVPKNPFIPILEGVKFEDGYLTAANNEVSMRVPFGGKLPDCVLQFATLSAAVNALQDDEISFDLNATAAVLKSGRTRINVPVLGNVADFIAFAADPAAPNCTLTRHDVERVAAMAAFASADTLRPAMMGVYYDGKDFVATNGHILSNYRIGGDAVPPCVLPMRLFTLLYSFQKATAFVFAAGAVTVQRDADVLAVVRFRCIDEQYPQWQNVVPALTKHAVAEFEREEMVDAIDVLNIAVNKTTQTGVFEFAKGGGVTASASDVELNKDASTGVAADITGLAESFRMGFNTNFLAAALKFVGGEMVRGYIDAPNRAAIFKNPEFNGFALVMPVGI
jgi:DNA polymerase III sliding clamp (beta) subunit (PCNA family)